MASLGCGVGVAADSGGPRLPRHLADILADPLPLLQPPEDGDVDTALALLGAREGGGELRYSMKGVLHLPLPMERFMRVEGLTIRTINFSGNRLTQFPSLDQVGKPCGSLDGAA